MRNAPDVPFPPIRSGVVSTSDRDTTPRAFEGPPTVVPDDLYLAADVDAPESLAAVAAFVRDWEPSLELCRPPADALLYEPDGTLYAVCLAESLTVRTGHLTRTVRRGDSLVIPRALAVDVEPLADVIAVRHDGPPPDHFRERFIQVWGLEHRPAPHPEATGVSEIIPASDARFRVPYATYDVKQADATPGPASEEPVILIGLEGHALVKVRFGPVYATRELQGRRVLALGPGVEWELSGPGRVGALTIINGLADDARRRGADGVRRPPPSVEYDPPPAP